MSTTHQDMSLVTDPRFAANVVLTWIIILVATFLWMTGFRDNQYLRFGFGPSDDLLYVGYALNTWAKWGGMVGGCIIDTCVTIWACDVVYPWLNFKLFDKKNKFIEFSWLMTMWIAIAMSCFQNMRPLVTAYLAFTQIDILAIRGLSEVFISFFTLGIYGRQKTFNVRPGDEAAMSINEID